MELAQTLSSVRVRGGAECVAIWTVTIFAGAGFSMEVSRVTQDLRMPVGSKIGHHPRPLPELASAPTKS